MTLYEFHLVDSWSRQVDRTFADGGTLFLDHVPEFGDQLMRRKKRALVCFFVEGVDTNSCQLLISKDRPREGIILIPPGPTMFLRQAIY